MGAAKQAWGWYPAGKIWVPMQVAASGKLVIDPTAIFENPPTNGETKKAPQSDWAYDHAADAAAHHIKYTDAEALAAGIAGGLSKIVWKDNGVAALADLNRTVTLDYTVLDLTVYTSANAKSAILRLIIAVDSYTGASSAWLGVRKNGSGATLHPVVYAHTDSASVYTENDVIVGLDSGQVLEYKIFIGGTIQVDSHIQVLGYIE
ncbi:MAG: hypothetical protein A2Y89_06715 [Chloroflexi bacterium RBG_13_51_18]|nr:MAG: hypothetical protein A2Y89_06715 [Chloroflexi bacterium RBG_13_51_18]